MRRQICVLGLVAALLAMVAVPAAAAPRKEKPAREVREALRAASRFLEAYPERRADLLPPGITQEELDDEIVITYRSHAGERKTTRLNTFEQSLIDLGRSILATQDRDNLVRVYSLVYEHLPAGFRPGLPLPTQVAGRALPEVQRAYGALVQRVGLNFAAILNILTPAAFTTRVTNPIGLCTDEAGYESAGTHSELSARCEIGEYGVDGLIRNFSFPLEDDLTCVRDQGRRGSCVAMSAIATIESLAMAQGAPAQTLSEQFFYYVGETYGDALDSLYQMQIQGLSMHLSLEAHIDNGFGAQYESDWNYNLAQDIGAASLDPALGVIVYPDSCGLSPGDYTGEACSDFVYQTPTTVPLPGIPQPGAPPPMPAAVHAIVSNSYLPGGAPEVVESSLQVAVMLLAGDVPLTMGGIFTDALADTVDGYVRDVPGDPVLGGHAVALVGFVPNAELPESIAPASEQGYFIAKNSWGTDSGDCGFVYLDYGYVRKHVDYLSVIGLR